MKRLPLWIGLGLTGALVVTAVVALVWTPYDPTHIVPSDALQGPSAKHWLGTQHQGIDVLSQLMAGARVCLLVGILAVGLAALVGVPLGVVAGMRRGWIDVVVMRLADIVFAFPALLLALLLAAAFGASVWTATIAIGIASIPAFARMARGATLQVMASDYVVAARVSGTTPMGIAWRHVLPNITPVVGIQASVSFGLAILAEAGLSYLGQGANATTITWGRMLLDARDQLWTKPDLVLWSGGAIALAVLGFNLVGDGLRDLLDPRLREVR